MKLYRDTFNASFFLGMRPNIYPFFGFIVCLFLSVAVHAETFAPSLTQDGETLILNGRGIRKATLLGIKVYEGALYLKTKATEADSILNSPDTKIVEIHYLRALNTRDSGKAWDHAFSQNCAPNCDALKVPYAAFRAALRDLNAGDIYRFVLTSKGVDVVANNEKVGSFDGDGFARAVLASWIGSNPPNRPFKKALLSSP